MKRAAILAGACVLAGAFVLPALAVPGGPHIRQFEYFEDYEGIGHRYNLSATIKGEADKVKARSGDVAAKGKHSSTTDTDPKGDVWFFRDKKFVKTVRADLYADGFAEVTVKAQEGGQATKKVCELHLEPDPQFGDYASGDCDKV